ncbi:hypothetical protein BKA70DRAFT_1451908 [Coprinopsis sp. MPI-PUGE-AT-0042]|nr:hypothetical protein BKA70DRAFT_1451908 [Coprinopsis sp. MPI-PUGE-AT-0042]
MSIPIPASISVFVIEELRKRIYQHTHTASLIAVSRLKDIKVSSPRGNPFATCEGEVERRVAVALSSYFNCPADLACALSRFHAIAAGRFTYDLLNATGFDLETLQIFRYPLTILVPASLHNTLFYELGNVGIVQQEDDRHYSGDPPANVEYTEGVVSFVRATGTGGGKITLLSCKDGPFHTLVSAHHTGLMNALSATRIYSFYLKSTTSGIPSANRIPAHYNTNNTFFRLHEPPSIIHQQPPVDNRASWTVPCGFCCPARLRKSIDDKGCLSYRWINPQNCDPALQHQWGWRDWDSEDMWLDRDCWEPRDANEGIVDVDGTGVEQFSWRIWETCTNPTCEFFQYSVYDRLCL